MQLTQEEDIRVLYAMHGLIGSLLGMALVGEKIESADIAKLMDALSLAEERIQTLEGQTNAAQV